MYTGVDFYITNQNNDEVFGFDFVNDMQPGDTILTAAWSLTVNNGQSAAPSTLFPGTFYYYSSTAVVNRISGLVAGVPYVLQCVVTTSLGDTLTLWTNIYSEIVG